jgi:Fic family protein
MVPKKTHKYIMLFVVRGDCIHRSPHRFWETPTGEPFNERQRSVLNRLLDGFEGKLTSSKWAALGKCSQDTASRDIDDLVKRGILVKNAAGGRSTSYSLAAGT